MIVASFIGHSVGALERKLSKVRQAEGKVIALKVATKEVISKAAADRAAAIAELKKELDLIGAIAGQI